MSVMAKGNVRVSIKVEDNFSKQTKKILFGLWRSLFGIRRFFLVDWWRFKLGLQVKIPGA